MKLEKNHRLGFLSMVLLGVNGIVGSGIFLLPGQIMNMVGNWSFAVYVLVTLHVLSIAWCFAQCAALFTKSGGVYLYAKEAFGDFIGFEIGLMRWVVGLLAWAALVSGFVTACSSIWPSVLFEPYRSGLIVFILGSLAVINILGIQLFQYINNLITIGKLLPLVLFVLLGVFYIDPPNYTPLVWNDFEWEAFGTASVILFYAFAGFETIVIAAGEMKNPKKNIPLAIMVAISFCSLLYFLVQLIGVGIMGERLADSLTPLSDVARILLGEIGVWIVSLAMLFSIGGTNLAASFIVPRCAVVLAEDGMIPRWIATKSVFGTPIHAIWLTMCGTAILALTGSFSDLIVISVFARFAQYISTCLAAYVLHRQAGVMQSLYKRCLLKIIPSFALLGIGWLLWQATFIQLVMSLGALLLGVPLYLLRESNQNVKESLQ